PRSNHPTTYFLVDAQHPNGYPQVVEEFSAISPTPSVSKAYSYGLRLISQRFSGGTIQYYGHDGHGNVRLLLSSAGMVNQSYSYDAFGILISPTTPPIGNDYLYCGEQWDRDLAL